MALSSWYEQRVLPRVIDKVCATPAFRPHRRDIVDGLDGVVLEIGFGSGLNMPHYPPTIERLLVVDPAELGLELAKARIAAVSFDVESIGRDGAVLPLDDQSVDHVVSTFTLCSIPDVSAALAEVRRVLRPGGTFRVLEHGLSPEPSVARWQRRLTPVQRRVAGGCHLDRAVVPLLESAGFELTSVRQWSEGRPKAMTFLTAAIAC